MKAFLWLLGIVIVVVAGWWFFVGRNGGGGASDGEFRTGRVERGQVVEGVEASGTVQPLELIEVGTQISGTIEKILVDFNSKVSAGETIALLDGRRLAAQVAEDEAAKAKAEADAARVEALLEQAKADVQRTEAQIAQAQAEVDRVDAGVTQAKADVQRVQALHVQAQADLERQRQLVAKRLTSPSDVDAAVATEGSLAAQIKVAAAAVLQSEAQLASAKASLRQDEAQRQYVAAALRAAQAQVDVSKAAIRQSDAQLQSDKVNLGYATIVSPVDGIVVSRNVDVGQTVAASLQAPTLFLIARDLTKVQVEAAVPEADIGHVHETQKASFTVDAYPDQTFDGEVTQVRLAATSISNVVTYTVVVQASNPKGILFPGMTALITFQVAESQKDALHVPSAALRVQPTADLVAEQIPPAPSRPASGSRNAGHGNHDGARERRAFVFVPLGGGKLKAVAVEPGISDGASTVVVPIDPSALPEGTEVVTAILHATAPTTTNPFAPSFHRGRR